MGNSRWVLLEDVTILKETDAAFLVELEDERQEWLPKSQIADPDDYNVGDVCDLSITEWIAHEKEIE